MKRSKVAQLKYVELLASYKILHSARLTPLAPVKDILNAVGADGSLGGSLPVSKAFELSLGLGTIVIDENSKLDISDKISGLLELDPDSEPDHSFLQGFISLILNEHKLPWVIFCNLDVVKFRSAIPPNWEVILENSGLLDFNEARILKWWRSLLFKYNEDKNLRLKKIGDIGESLTLSFEQDRIKNSGLDHTILVSWAASVDDEMGFDIISAFGSDYDGIDNEEIYIEVKASELSNVSAFRFYISRNEWEKAIEYGDSYFFYCWCGVKTDGGYHKGPFAFKAKQISSIIPVDQDDQGEWRNCRVTINLDSFDILGHSNA